MSKKKILFIVNHRKNRSPGQKFRFEQYLNYLEQNGFECRFSPLLNEKDDKIFYSKGNYIGKLKVFLKANWIRFNDWRKMNDYDIIFIFREAMMTGSTFFEKKFSRSRAKVVFDFDDSIWLQTVSEGNKKLAFLKNAEKTERIIKLADLVFAGNQYLANYASQFNSNIVIVPTTIDTSAYQPIEKTNSSFICIGWTGSFSTIQHFEYRLNALKKIKEKYRKKVQFKVIGDGSYFNEDLEVRGLPWKKETEVKDLEEIDIGIMPLPNDEWAKGKCGLKGLQYMGLSIATIMSPVGVNTEIVKDGINGFLAESEEEWVDKLSLLIEFPDLRKRIGAEGRKTVVEKYSVDVNKDLYLTYLKSLL
jgi:glycosyltransferase involved in cell wall biosynthesis